MGPIWGRQDTGGPHVGPMNFSIWVYTWTTPDTLHTPCLCSSFRMQVLQRKLTMLQRALFVSNKNVFVLSPKVDFIHFRYSADGFNRCSCWRLRWGTPSDLCLHVLKKVWYKNAYETWLMIRSHPSSWNNNCLNVVLWYSSWLIFETSI